MLEPLINLFEDKNSTLAMALGTGCERIQALVQFFSVCLNCGLPLISFHTQMVVS